MPKTTTALDVDAILSACDFRRTARESFALCHGANTPHEAAQAWASEYAEQIGADWDQCLSDVEELAERLCQQWERVANQAIRCDSTPEEWQAWVLGVVAVLEDGECVWLASRGDGCAQAEKDYRDSCTEQGCGPDKIGALTAHDYRR